MINLGNQKIGDIYLGDKPISKVYQGEKLVYEKVKFYIPETEITLYDSVEKKELVILNTKYNLSDYPKERYTPIGIVVIPQSHSKILYPEDHACHNKPVMMSLKYMRYDSPDTGGESQNMDWGGYGTDLSLQNYWKSAVIANSVAEEDSTESSKSYSYIPSTKFTAWESKAAPKTFYYSTNISLYPPCPSPFLFKDDEWQPNPAYYNCPSTCVQTYRDGKGNTQVILDAVTVADWKTADTIANSSSDGNYPAACCCWRFHTVADNQGDWYLPAGGELGYIISFFSQHNNAINRINQIYGESSFAVALGTSDYYWSSSEGTSRHHVYRVDADEGRVFYDSKESSSRVRAFRPVNI